MSSQLKEISQERKRKGITKYLLMFPAVALFVLLSGLMPDAREHGYNFAGMLVGLAFASVYVISAGIMMLKSRASWWADFTARATIFPVGGGVMAFNWATNRMMNLWLSIPLALAYVLAVLLPFIHEKTAERLHREMKAPTSWIGRLLVFFILAIGPAAGSFGVFLSGVAKRSQGMSGYTFFGLFGCLFLIWGTATTVYDGWEERPWKAKEHKDATN